MTITSEPSCEVYSVSVGSGSGGNSAPLEGKTVVCFGDSLFGMYSGNNSAPAYVAKYTGATVYNVGFGGCRMSEHPYPEYDEFCMYALANAVASGDWSAQDAEVANNGSANFPEHLALLKSIDFGAVDAIVIHYGTNDFAAGSGVAIDNTSNPKATNTLCGALRYSVETLLTAYPHLNIFISLPAFRFWTADDGTVTYSDEKTDVNGKTFLEFVDALAKTAKEYNLPVIDCYYGLGINKSNAAAFLSDGTHHNVEGRKRFGEYIGAKLISGGDTFHDTDSATNGSGSGSSGESASINVTAEVGQTIVVEEVDKNGKPTKWRAADFQERTHWFNKKGELFNAHLTGLSSSEVLIDVKYEAGKTYYVTWNGIEYTCIGIDLGTGVLIGNTLALDLEDTGEPFVSVNAVENGIAGTVIMAMDDTDETDVIIRGEKYEPIPIQYVSNALPYYIDAVGEIISDRESVYTTIETVERLTEILGTGRDVILRVNEQTSSDGTRITTIYRLTCIT